MASSRLASLVTGVRAAGCSHSVGPRRRRRLFSSLMVPSFRSHAVPGLSHATPQGSVTTLVNYRRQSVQSLLFQPAGVPRRTMFIQTEATPNEDALRFIPGVPVLEDTTNTIEFMSAREALKSPLATRLFGVDGVKSVMFGSEFISVVKDPDTPWQLMKPDIYAAIMDHFSSGKPLLRDPSSHGKSSTDVLAEDSDIVAEIKELLETRIRPSIQEDGGDLDFVGFDETSGLVKIKLRGACRGCASSTITLKNGIENMLRYYIPEVQTVEDVTDELEAQAAKELEKLEARLAKEEQERERQQQ
ncbi:hypothetical protein EV182_002941 [Spiromyces aspiralis]|uniref:Uncharacterized protein n=1 Tax=Spiromyces aspiralis TaxID=68401 RepID=A0ACC1HRT3_9FUNG|nr:hypothetical protein EV182_002941 [Spiromyces aspiralis]